ncbi:MAG: Hsp20/alpha crystallin family protein [Scytolyngbya sp. HA4215-MV1]|nr:Hsp20/alpha crystallin family protein [Scytolyngbya sp. HA4215-MV1]
MAHIRLQPWYELDTFRRQMDQLLDEVAIASRDSLSRFRETATAWAPAVELKGTDTEFVLQVQLPGIAPNELDIQVGREAVSIAGETRPEPVAEESGFFRTEFRYGKFYRVVSLPAAVQNDQVKAEFKDGILTLTLPRFEAARPKVVKVKLGETQDDSQA